ncbi:MAG: tryptophan--tRNA ligase, partial [Cyanobacteria bacterium]|nr:tryptophan--tRNA ligase [Cyanobacteriota bacterium]
VLMSADILVFKGELVPVGKDQESHLEFARNLARKFNHLYKVDFFPEPKPEFTAAALVKGTDGRKMGKSFDNDIKLADTAEDTTKQVMKMVTDRTRIGKNDPGHTDLCEVPWPMYLIVAPEMREAVREECESAQIGCVGCKKRLAEQINEYLRPIRERREKFARDPERLEVIIKHGNKKARERAKETLTEVREIMGLTNWNLD